MLEIEKSCSVCSGRVRPVDGLGLDLGRGPPGMPENCLRKFECSC